MIDIDYTGSQILQQTIAGLRSRSIEVAIARLSDKQAQVEASRTGLIAALGPERVFKSVEEAVRRIGPNAKAGSGWERRRRRLCAGRASVKEEGHELVFGDLQRFPGLPVSPRQPQFGFVTRFLSIARRLPAKYGIIQNATAHEVLPSAVLPPSPWPKRAAKGRCAAVRSHLGLRISDFEPNKPSNVRISGKNILTFDGFLPSLYAPFWRLAQPVESLASSQNRLASKLCSRRHPLPCSDARRRPGHSSPLADFA